MQLGDFTGVKGIPNQDIVMWETMGPIADRSRERLGASDLAVVEFRKLMVDAAKQMRDTGVAIGTTPPHIPHTHIRSSESIVSKSTDWRTFTVTNDSEESKGRHDIVRGAMQQYHHLIGGRRSCSSS